MKLSLVSCGAVTPGGFGEHAALSEWPLVETFSERGQSVQAGLVDSQAAELVRWQKEPRLRRASPITYFMVEAAAQALANAPGIDRKRVGIVSGFFLGCLVYSVRFYRQITNEGRRFGSPVLFPETVFNSPLSHVVSTLKLGGPVYSQIGDKTCWASALRTAQCWLARDQCDHVIVMGAEEFEPHEVDALHAGGLMRGPIHPCEGAVALLLGPRDSGQASIGDIAEGFGFHSRSDALRAASECLRNFSADAPVLDTARGWTRRPAARLDRNVVGKNPGAAEGFTMSAAVDTLRALHWIQQGLCAELVVPVWGLTNSMSAFRVAA